MTISTQSPRFDDFFSRQGASFAHGDFFLTINGSTLYSPKKETLVSLPTVSLTSSFFIWKATFAPAFLLNLCYFKNYLLVMAAPTSIIFFSDSCSVLSTAYIPSLRHFFFTLYGLSGKKHLILSSLSFLILQWVRDHFLISNNNLVD